MAIDMPAFATRLIKMLKKIMKARYAKLHLNPSQYKLLTIIQMQLPDNKLYLVYKKNRYVDQEIFTGYFIVKWINHQNYVAGKR
jgi:hypothetical protein